MTKHKFVPLAILTLSIVSIHAKAQLTTNTAALQKASIAARIEEKNLQIRLLSLARQKGWPMTMTNKQGRRSFLVGVDAKGYPLYVGVNDNIISAATIRTNLLWPGGSTGLNLNGSSNNLKGKIAIWDEAKPRPTHVELANRVVQKDDASTISDHSTHVSGTMIAAGINPAAKGMAYGEQQLLAYDFNSHLSEMLAESPNLLVSNHSYGTIAGWNFNTDVTPNRWEFLGNAGDTVDYKFGYYSAEAQMWDSIAYNAPQYLIVKSVGNNRDINGPAVGQPYWRYNASGIMTSAGNRPAGISSNNGFDIIPTYGVAKNILSVGAVNPIPSGYTQPSDVVLSSFTSFGPSDDGRIKPDVVTDGVDVLSCVGSSDNAYAVFSGTSMSSPAAAGSSLLLQEYYSKQHGGAFMRSATLRGLIIHTADEAGTAPGPDFEFGWGLINMEKAASVITSNNTDQLIYENNLTNGSSFTLPVVASGKGALVATICWTDPKASVDQVNVLNNPAKKLINDLDLRISDGTTTFTPYVLDWKHPANPATNGDDTLNNVEKIVISNAIPGKTYTVKVTHKGTLARGQQAYSLLVSGVGGSAYCASNPTSTAGTRIDSVIISNVKNGNTNCATKYNDYTNLTAQIQPNQTLPFTIKLSTCDAATPSNIVKIYIDYNNNGLFTDAGENVATSGVISSGNSFSGNIVVPSGLTVGNYTRMRIVVEEGTDATLVNPCGTYGNGETEDYRIQVVSPSNDVGVTQLVDPLGAICDVDSERVTIRIKNFGTSNQLNVPITTTIQNGATTVATFNTVCPDTIPALGEVVYTFQPTFHAVAGTTYTITSKTNLPGDQNTANDQNVSTVAVSTGGNTTTGTAEICTINPPSASLQANVVDSNDVAVWYDSPTATTPITSGNKATTNVIPANNTYYLALNDIDPSVGPANKMAFTSGGYNSFSGNFVKIHNSVPLTIQSSKLYIGHGGKITFIVADIVDFNATTGEYSYFPVSTNTIDVYPTTPTPAAGPINGNNAADTGAVFYLNLPIPETGDHAIIIECQNGATIFRNNNITSNPYPFSIPGVFDITGNSAINTSNASDTTFYQGFYYFFYNMQIQLADCPGPRVAVTASTATAPVITLDGKILSSNVATGNQWYLNDSLLVGKTGQNDTVGAPGAYKDVVTDALGCAIPSNTIVYSTGNDIGLVVAPNPNNGQFNLQFYINTNDDVNVSVLNAIGQRVYAATYPNFNGYFNQQINIQNVSAGVYFLRLQIGGKKYIKKIVVK